ncbi:MAG: hypothetical protein U9R05_04440 [Chloroflexota bacterium]|nr:hypothetical protein [Chloroflexota bacterium]
MSTLNPEPVAAALAARFADDRWLVVLQRLARTGVADRTQLLALPGLTADKFESLYQAVQELAPGRIFTATPQPLPRPGRPGRPPTAYTLGPLGAALLRSHGQPQAQPCGLTTVTQLSHAREMLNLYLAAGAADLPVALDRPLSYGAGQTLRPDLLVTLPGDNPPALYEIEQRANVTLLRRIRDSVRHKVAFFQSAAGRDVSPTVRVLINLPRGALWEQTLSVWERAIAATADEHGGALPCRWCARPLLDFLAQPDWAEPPDPDRWSDLFDPAQTQTFSLAPSSTSTPAPRARPPALPAGLRRWSVPDSHLILRALWQHLQEQGPTLLATSDRPLSHPIFFLTLQVIYAASYPPDVTPWEHAQHPHASLYLLRRYFQMHPALRQALSKTIVRGSSTIKWSTPLVTHKMQIVIDLFLRYHGLHSRGTLTAAAIGPWRQSDDRGAFGVRVSLHPEVLLGPESGVLPTPEEVTAAETALAWVLESLFVYSHELGLKSPPFW